jgi:peptidoglycan/LPS O-acetylase OafA/YrhL
MNKETLFVAYHLSVTYMILWVAYVPNGGIRKFNQLGDYSYGVYIYAFPVQQSVALLSPGISVMALMIFSSIGALFLAYISWHLVEKHALELKPRFAVSTR